MYKIDAHNHADWHGHDFNAFIKNMDELGINKCWILSWECPHDEFNPEDMWAFPTSRLNNIGHTLSDNGPIPFSLGLEYKNKAPDRFILGYAPDPRRPDALKTFQSAVATYGVRIYGELKVRMMYDNPDAIRLYRWCGQKHIPVTMHFDNDTATRTGREFPRQSWWYGGDISTLERVLKLCPETDFLGHAPGFWCHISKDELGITTAYPRGPVIPGGEIERLLDTYDNLYCDMSAGSCHTALSRDLEYTRKLIMKHPDRFVYARDYFDNVHAELIDSLALSTEIRELIYHGNAEHLIGE